MQELPLFFIFAVFIIFSEQTNVLPRMKGDPHMKEEYISKIIEQLPYCNDISLLDLIYKLLLPES
jgi:hypothetical protein